MAFPMSCKIAARFAKRIGKTGAGVLTARGKALQRALVG